ncbi:hypothetical protein CLU79DRAFT_771467 [Phycomyces nitens]|nr:hypothetical protein CLU79DRAFT_771467 [Phycomyces nitens]
MHKLKDKTSALGAFILQKDPFEFKPRSYSIYLASIIINDKNEILTTLKGYIPTLPVITKDRLAYHSLTLDSHEFLSALKHPLTRSAQSRLPSSAFKRTVQAMINRLGCPDLGQMFRNIVEFRRPSIKIFVTIQRLSASSCLLANDKRIKWIIPHRDQLHALYSSFHSFSHVWFEAREIYDGLSSRVQKRGLYLALFYVHDSSLRGQRLLVERHKEHIIPCVWLRGNTSLSGIEKKWLHGLAHKITPTGQSDCIDSPAAMDFLTVEEQQRQQRQQLQDRVLLAPFQKLIFQGQERLEKLTGVPIDLKDIFNQDTLCLSFDTNELELSSAKVSRSANTLLTVQYNKAGQIEHCENNDYPMQFRDMLQEPLSMQKWQETRDDDVRILVIIKSTADLPLSLLKPLESPYIFFPLSFFQTFHFASKSIAKPISKPTHVTCISDMLKPSELPSEHTHSHFYYSNHSTISRASINSLLSNDLAIHQETEHSLLVHSLCHTEHPSSRRASGLAKLFRSLALSKKPHQSQYLFAPIRSLGSRLSHSSDTLYMHPRTFISWIERLLIFENERNNQRQLITSLAMYIHNL